MNFDSNFTGYDWKGVTLAQIDGSTNLLKQLVNVPAERPDATVHKKDGSRRGRSIPKPHCKYFLMLFDR